MWHQKRQRWWAWKKEKGGILELNTIRWQTCPLMKNGSALELAWTIDEVHMVHWGLKLCSPKSTRREWWAQLAPLSILKWLNCHHINCKQLIFKWIFHTFMGVLNIQHWQWGRKKVTLLFCSSFWLHVAEIKMDCCVCVCVRESVWNKKDCHFIHRLHFDQQSLGFVRCGYLYVCQ